MKFRDNAAVIEGSKVTWNVPSELTGIIIVDILPSSIQTCTFVIDRLSTLPLMVNGSLRKTFRLDLSVGGEGIDGPPATAVRFGVAFAVSRGIIHPEVATITMVTMKIRGSTIRTRNNVDVMRLHPLFVKTGRLFIMSEATYSVTGSGRDRHPAWWSG